MIKMSLRKQAGVNIIELMIAMALSLLLLGSVVQVFFATKTTFRSQEALSRIQENARFAINRIRNDLQQAGFVGCVRSSVEGTSNVTSILDVTGASSNMFDFTHAFFGAEGSSLNSDEIFIRYADVRSKLSVSQFNATGLAFDFEAADFNALDTDDQLVQYDIAAATDCGQTLVFLITNDPGADNAARVTSGTASTKTETSGISNSTQPSKSASAVPPVDDPLRQSYLYRLRSVRYFLNNTTGLPSGSSGRSLYRQVGNDVPQALIDGVQRLNFEYGFDSDADGSADTFVDWSGLSSNAERQAIVSVRMTMEFNSGKAILDSNTTTVGVAQNAEEFKSISTTIQVRNRFGGT